MVFKNKRLIIASLLMATVSLIGMDKSYGRPAGLQLTGEKTLDEKIQKFKEAKEKQRLAIEKQAKKILDEKSYMKKPIVPQMSEKAKTEMKKEETKPIGKAEEEKTTLELSDGEESEDELELEEFSEDEFEEIDFE